MALYYVEQMGLSRGYWAIAIIFMFFIVHSYTPEKNLKYITKTRKSTKGGLIA